MQFNMAAGSANQYQPGKRPFHTIIPGFATILDDDGVTEHPWLSFGVMGGNIQPQGHAQSAFLNPPLELWRLGIARACCPSQPTRGWPSHLAIPAPQSSRTSSILA